MSGSLRFPLSTCKLLLRWVVAHFESVLVEKLGRAEDRPLKCLRLQVRVYPGGFVFSPSPAYICLLKLLCRYQNWRSTPVGASPLFSFSPIWNPGYVL